MSVGLLEQLPDLGELEQIRDSVQKGLDDALKDVADDPASLVKPVTEALAPVTHEIPDLSKLIEPLEGQLDQIVGSLPSGLDEQVAELLPLLNSAEQAVTSGALTPILEDIRAGRSLNDIARDGLDLFAQELLGQLPSITGDVLSDDTLAAVNEFLSLVSEFQDGTPDPDQLADFLAAQLLGVPLSSLSDAATVGDNFFGLLEGMLAAAGQTVDDAEQTLTTQITTAATRLEALDPTQPGDWVAALTALQEAQAGLDGLRGAMQTVPGTVYSGLGQFDLDRYKTDLQQALQSLLDTGSNGPARPNSFASLEDLTDNILQPLDELTGALDDTSPDEFGNQLSATLDMLLALFDSMAEVVQDNPVFDFFDDLKQVMDTVADAIRGVQTVIDSAIKTLVEAIEGILEPFNTVKEEIEAAFQTLETAIEEIDIEALAQEVEGLLNQVNDLLAAIPLDDLKDMLDQALTTVEQLINTLSETAQTVLQQVESLVSALEEIEFDPLVEPVIDAINAIKNALSAINLDLLPEAIQSLLQQAIDAFEDQFNGDFNGYFQREVIDFLNNLFDEAVTAISDFVQSLQDKLRQFAEAVGKLDPAALLEPLTQVFQQLTNAINELSGEKLIGPVRELVDEMLEALTAISPATLFAPLEQAFEQEILTPVQQFKPSDLLQPLIDAFAPLEELIDKLDFSSAFEGLAESATEFFGSTKDSLTGALDFSGVPGVGEMAEQVQPVLDLLSPTTSLEDWTAVMEDLLNNHRPAKLLEPIQTALTPVENVLNNASDELLMATFDRLKAVTGVTELVSSSATTNAFRSQLEQVASALESNLPAAVIAGLNAGYTRIQAALNQVDPNEVPEGLRPQYDTAQAAVVALDPVTTLDPLSELFAPLAARIRQVATWSVDLSDLEEMFGTALSTAAGRLPGFLFDELTPASIRQGLVIFSPTALLQRIDERFDAFLNTAEGFSSVIQTAVEGFIDQLGLKLAELSPAALFEEFGELFQPIREALQSSPQAIADTLDQAYEQMLEKLALVHPKVIREPAQALFDTVLAKLNELKQQLLDTLATAIDQILAQIRETLRALDPQALIIGLGNFFELIRQALEELALTELIDRLVQAFDTLRANLTAALQRSADAFGQMVEAIPL